MDHVFHPVRNPQYIPLGHSRASFTLDRYVHLLPGRDQEAAERIDVSLRKAIEETRKGKVM